MKNLVIIAVISLLVFSCKTSQNTDNKNLDKTDSTKIKINELSQDTIRITNEELEYEIIIIELGFDSWLATQKPMSYYSQSTLEIKNKFYVIEWNRRVDLPDRYNPSLYEQKINYQYYTTTNYGMEVNYKLYMYFKFFEKKYNQNLLYGDYLY